MQVRCVRFKVGSEDVHNRSVMLSALASNSYAAIEKALNINNKNYTCHGVTVLVGEIRKFQGLLSGFSSKSAITMLWSLPANLDSSNG